ncbi:unnamed protein product [Ambrosiozyma monospora]|uniref:Unnamed protein product n=1 Tax=Ambrosiozyma monospora TaxID=43982 RepID=A0A9W6YY78_AMBMO|nr:unnamed protein product [Ambrosiozyma monospora]
MSSFNAFQQTQQQPLQPTLTYQSLVQVLTTASVVSNNSTRNNSTLLAEQQLKKWESAQGYHFLLQSVYNENTLPLQIRWLAIICLKNGVEKYWRSTRINSITKDEKIEIRKSLFKMLDEQNNQLCIQNAHCVARIARIDFPSEWSSLFDDFSVLLQNCSNGNNINLVRLYNILLILNQVLKILATVKIGRAKAAMHSKISVIMPHLIKFYHILFEKTSSEDMASIEVGYLCLKNLRRAIVDVNTNRVA